MMSWLLRLPIDGWPIAPTFPMLKLLYRSQMSALPAPATVSQDGRVFYTQLVIVIFIALGHAPTNSILLF